MENKTMIQTVTDAVTGACRSEGAVGAAEDNARDYDSLLYAAEQGDAAAQFVLAEWFYKKYEEGDGLERDLEEAVRWYQEAAGHGDARAQFEIGWCYQSGNGVEEDPEKAVKWFGIAAEQGYARAQYWLGWCYRYGNGVEADLEKAVKWYGIAAEQGNEDALEDLRDLGCDVSWMV